MNLKRPKLNWKQNDKGQSFIELLLVFTVLMVLLVGMVEFGNLLNQYINLVDGAREGARYVSNDDPFASGNYENFFAKVYETVQGRYDASGVQLSKGAINPIVLSKENHDDIVVTFFSIATNPALHTKAVTRFESAAGSRYNEQTSEFSNAQILAMVDSGAPNTGGLLVEVFYNYHQLTGLFTWLWTNPDPTRNGTLLVHSYSLMPLSSAEPTPTPHP